MNTNHTDLRNEILKVVSYYALFKHPLLMDEIYRLLQIKTEREVFDICFNEMLADGYLYMHHNYYSTIDEANLVTKRVMGEKKAAELMPKAILCARFISIFPFVKFVGISGSLSKCYADTKTDFDFFIVTSTNRLWICRTLLHLFKKCTFVINRQHYFCMNYFIDESSYAIEDKNLFVRYELAHLVPVYNSENYQKLMLANAWVKSEMPQFMFYEKALTNYQSVLKTIAEICLRILPLNKLNTFLMRLTDNKWRRKWKYANYPMEDYELAFRTRINISKNHPMNHQKSILTQLSKFEK